MDYTPDASQPDFQRSRMRKLIALCCSNESKPKLNPFFYVRFRLFGSIVLRELNSLLAKQILDATDPLYNAKADSRVFVLRTISIWVDLFLKLKFTLDVKDSSLQNASSDKKIIFEIYTLQIKTYRNLFLTILCTIVAVVPERKNPLDYLEVLDKLIKFFTISKDFEVHFADYLKRRGLDLISFLKQIERTPLLEVHNLSLRVFHNLPVDHDSLIKDDPENMLRICIEWLFSEKQVFFRKALQILEKFLEFHDRKTLKALFRPHLANIYALIQNKFSVRYKKQTLFETTRYNFEQISLFLKIASKMAFLFYQFLPSNSFAVDVPPEEQIRVFLSRHSSSETPIQNPTETRLSLDDPDCIKEEVDDPPAKDTVESEFGVEVTLFLNRILREGLSMASMGNFFKFFDYSNGKYDMIIRGHKPLLDKLFGVLHPLLLHLVKHGVTIRVQSKYFFRMFDSYLFVYYCIYHRDHKPSESSRNPFQKSAKVSPKSEEMFDQFFEHLLRDKSNIFEVFQFLFCFAYKDVRLSLSLPLNPVFKKIRNLIFLILGEASTDAK